MYSGFMKHDILKSKEKGSCLNCASKYFVQK